MSIQYFKEHPPKGADERYCQQCGVPINRQLSLSRYITRKFCGQACSNKARQRKVAPPVTEERRLEYARREQLRNEARKTHGSAKPETAKWLSGKWS